mmetsp:Transcript_35807/g.65175  ORF Transcript_35807/g.65175 Transcript_35807/m.65175 type:complete len:266 (-) Transcript_35807:68-865(-)
MDTVVHRGRALSFFRGLFSGRMMLQGSSRSARSSSKVHIDAERTGESSNRKREEELLMMEARERKSSCAPVSILSGDDAKRYTVENEGMVFDELEQLSETMAQLASRAFIPFISYFFRRALEFRRSCENEIMNEASRDSLFKDIVEEFIVGSAPLCLDFLSPETKQELIQRYFSQPNHFLTQRTPELDHYMSVTACKTDDEESLRDHYCDNDSNLQLLPTGVFDKAIIESMNFAYSSFKQQDLPVDCLYRLHCILFEQLQSSASD